MSIAAKPVLWLIAGPNGVGKTTYAKEHIRRISASSSFVNLDEIARGISPLDPEAERVRAARIAIDLLHDLIHENGTGQARKSLTLETTLAGRTHFRSIAEAKRCGFDVYLLYFMVRTPEVALARIARRVSEGGHNVPEADARRRYLRSIGNFAAYAAMTALWRVFDNNGSPRAVAEGRGDCRAFLADDLGGLPPELASHLHALRPCPEAA